MGGSGVRRCLPDSAWNVDQGISAIQKGERILMPMHEPLLHVPLFYGKQEREHPILLSLQHSDTVCLRDIPDVRLAKQPLRRNARHAVKSVVDDPVEHLDQEGEFLQHPAVDIALEPACVGRVHEQTTPSPRLGQMLGSGDGILRIVLVFGVIRYQFV